MVDALPPVLRLHGTERNPCATDSRESLRQVAEARSDPAAEIDHMSSRGENAQALRDLCVDIVECVGAAGDAGRPHGAVDGAAALPQRHERRCIAVVVPTNVLGAETGHSAVKRPAPSSSTATAR